jgi:glycosyltransferase involved in cell wall biosynthesis
MKILIASTIVPFIEGGGLFIGDWLEEILRQYGYRTEFLKIPFHSYYPVMLEQMLALRLWDLSESADLLITIRTPSYLLEHPNKVLWFIHHHRGAYDLWGTPYQDIPHTPKGLSIRQAIINADNNAFKQARKIYTNSQIISDRLFKYNGFPSEVLYPPLMKPEQYYCEDYQDFIFYPSRITSHKRQDLAIKAMQYTQTPVKLVVAGKPESPEYLQQMKTLIKENYLEKKVTLLDDWITQEQKIDFFAHALGALYIPFEEDSYGYVSLEAHHAQKAVITCQDSGGTLELIDDGINGFITEPTPQSLAEAMDKLYLDKSLAQKMGKSGQEKLITLNINWDNVVQRLVR